MFEKIARDDRRRKSDRYKKEHCGGNDDEDRSLHDYGVVIDEDEGNYVSHDAGKAGLPASFPRVGTGYRCRAVCDYSVRRRQFRQNCEVKYKKMRGEGRYTE